MVTKMVTKGDAIKIARELVRKTFGPGLKVYRAVLVDPQRMAGRISAALSKDELAAFVASTRTHWGVSFVPRLGPNEEEGQCISATVVCVDAETGEATLPRGPL